MKASRIATRTLLSAFVFACTAIAIAITLCATLSQAAADETATSAADKPLAMTAADGSLTTVPYPQGKAFVYDGTEKNAVDADLVAVDDGFIFRDAVAEAAMGADHTAACTNTGDLYMWGSNALSQLGIEGIEQSLTPVKLLSGVKKTDVGTWHSAAITDEGDLYLWGDNSLGQIGAGYNTRYKPVKVLSHVKQVSLGHYYSAAVTDNGDLYMWGRGEYGQLGVGQRTTLYAPVKVLSDVARVECGAEHTAAITTNGDLYMWGNNDHGKLGDGTNESRLTPVKVFSNVAQVSLGYSFTAALTTSGEVYTWGAGTYGSLGDGAHADRYSPAKVFDNVAEISSGDGHTGVITADGDLYMWGGNLEKQINDSDTQRFYYPTEVLSNVAHVSLGPGTTSVIDTSGKLLTWGSNTSGTLGDGTTVTRGTPAEVEGIVSGDSLVRFYEQDPGDAVKATDPGTYHCYAVPCDGYSWEDGTRDPVEINWSIAPTGLVPFVQGKTFVYDGTEKNAVGQELTAVDGGFIMNDVAASCEMGSYHGAALTTTGDLYMWGDNGQGSIGVNTYDTPYKQPVKVLSNVKQVSLGFLHSAAITYSGELYMWGYNSSGQLGDGTTSNRRVPTKIMDNVAQVALGSSYSAAVTTDGELYMWGQGDAGQLGVGTTENHLTPVKVALDNVAQVSCGQSHSAAVTTAGELYAWGSNSSGIVGDGTTEFRPSPVKVELDHVAQVSLGNMHSAALTTSGELYTWGNSSYGEIGDGTTETRYTPTKVLDDVAQISMGAWHSAAVTTSGDLLLWGRNTEGQLGDRDGYRRTTPTKTLSGIAQVACGTDTTAAVTLSGEAYTSGENNYAQLGIGTTERPYAFTKVSGIGTGQPCVRLFEQDPGDAVYATDAGTYHCYAVPYNGFCWQDGTCDPIEVNWAIDKAAYDMSGVTFDDAAFAHDGTAHSIEVTGELPEGVTVSYEGNGQTEPGTYTVTARFAGDTRNHKLIDAMTASLTVNEAPNWMRLGGKTRYDTMAAIVDQTFPETSDYAVLVSGANFPDALSAASLAGMYECPVITTKPDALSSQARAELERLGAKNVFIVGGTGAVSKAVETAVADLNGGVTVTRISGSTRYNTAIEVMKHVAGPRPVFTVFVATGKNFPDALAASPYSYANRAPIVLIDPDKGITSAQVNAIRNVGAMRVVLLGGSSAVPESVATTLRDSGIYQVLRISGNTRYTTAIEVAKWSAQNGSNLSAPVVATGLKDADALVGAALAGKNSSVLLLVDEKNDKGKPIAAPAVDFLADHAAEVQKGYILGGENAVSRAMVERILAATYGVLVDSPASLIGQSVDTAIDMTAQLAADNRQFTAAQIG